MALPRAPTPAAFGRRVARAGRDSSSPSAGPLPPAGHPRRSDLPARGPTRYNITSRSSLSHAVARLNQDKFAATSRKTYAARLAWWRRQHRAHGGRPWPLDITRLQAAAATLKAGGYRSAAQYLHALKRHHVCLGHSWTDQLARELADCTRSCRRGLGPAVQAQPLPLSSWVTGPLPAPTVLTAGIDAILVGSWWLMREIELAGMVVADLELAAGTGCGTATILLAVSKTDPSAKGVRRTLGCCCPNVLCPTSAARRRLRSATGLASTDFIVRTLDGVPATKSEVVREIKSVGRLLGVSKGISGHSLRVTGAQRLALAGVAIPRITLFGRWAGKSMILYAREALLGARGGGLAEQVAEIDFTERGLATLARAARPGAPASAVREFVLRSGSEPMNSLDKVDLLRTWDTVAEQADCDRSSSSSSLPPLIPSRAGVTHKTITSRVTRCGWHWGANDDAVAAPAGAVISCRKCAGKRLRWGVSHRSSTAV